MTTAPVRLFHFDITGFANAGDTLLFEMTRQSFGRFGDGNAFKIVGSRNLRLAVTEEVVERINAEADAVVIGGGGLFLRDTNANANSGWQWNCSLEMLRKIQKPIILFAVGYNRFRGQEDFDPIYERHLNETLDRSVFVGIRNSGSMEQLRQYVKSPDNRDKIVLQPCPTTISLHLFPVDRSASTTSDKIDVNVAMDRATARLPQGLKAFEQSIADLVTQLGTRAGDVELVNHCRVDTNLTDVLPAKQAAHVVNSFTPFEMDRFLDRYATSSTVIGMRGHGQMIPFGLGVPIISIISHNKMRYFLNDSDLGDFGVEADDPDLVRKTVELVDRIRTDRPAVVARLDKARERFLGITLDNLGTIYKTVAGRPAPVSGFNSWSRPQWREHSLETLVRTYEQTIADLRKHRPAAEKVRTAGTSLVGRIARRLKKLVRS